MFKLQSCDQLQARLESRKTKLAEYGVSVQPIACVVGPLEQPDGYYIAVSDVIYKVNSSIRALELLFKLFHGLDVDYPTESEAIWLFIAELVFEMKPLKKNPSAIAVLSDVKYHILDNN